MGPAISPILTQRKGSTMGTEGEKFAALVAEVRDHIVCPSEYEGYKNDQQKTTTQEVLSDSNDSTSGEST